MPAPLHTNPQTHECLYQALSHLTGLPPDQLPPITMPAGNPDVPIDWVAQFNAFAIQRLGLQLIRFPYAPPVTATQIWEQTRNHNPGIPFILQGSCEDGEPHCETAPGDVVAPEQSTSMYWLYTLVPAP